MTSALPILGAAVGGLAPALLWLWFWLREDSAHPEPRRLIALAFLSGMLAVAVVIPIEQWFQSMITDQTDLFIAWAATEEIVKFIFAYIAVLRLADDDEPIDAIIYMIVVALGFAAAENFLFLYSPISGTTLPQTVITGDFRFVGATLLHVLASSAIGASLALSFYKRRAIKIEFLICGVILAVFLHALFNVLIMNSTPADMMRTFAMVWAGVIGLLALLEFVKRLPRQA